jgi:hypothetical protein
MQVHTTGNPTQSPDHSHRELFKCCIGPRFTYMGGYTTHHI